MEEVSPQKLRLAACLERQLRTLGAHLSAESVGGDVSPVEWLLLCQVKEEPGLTLTMLATSLQMPVSSASRLLQGLTDRGFVQSRRPDDNRRIYAIELTPLGSKMQETARPSARGRTRRGLYRLSEADLELVTRILTECMERRFSGEGDP